MDTEHCWHWQVWQSTVIVHFYLKMALIGLLFFWSAHSSPDTRLTRSFLLRIDSPCRFDLRKTPDCRKSCPIDGLTSNEYFFGAKYLSFVHLHRYLPIVLLFVTTSSWFPAYPWYTFIQSLSLPLLAQDSLVALVSNQFASCMRCIIYWLRECSTIVKW